MTDVLPLGSLLYMPCYSGHAFGWSLEERIVVGKRNLPRNGAEVGLDMRQCPCTCHNRNTHRAQLAIECTVYFVLTAVGTLLKAGQERENGSRNICAAALTSSRKAVAVSLLLLEFQPWGTAVTLAAVWEHSGPDLHLTRPRGRERKAGGHSMALLRPAPPLYSIAHLLSDSGPPSWLLCPLWFKKDGNIRVLDGNFEDVECLRFQSTSFPHKTLSLHRINQIPSGFREC